MSESTKRSVAVVGGGISGLTVAYELQKLGIDVQLYEAAERVGGVVGTQVLAGYVCESAANTFLSRPPEGALALCSELGVPTATADADAKHRWIYRHGRLHSVPRDPISLVRSRLLSTRGKLRLLAEPLKRTSPDDESVYDWAVRRLGQEAADAVIAPFVVGIYASSAKTLSLRACFPKLAALEAQGGLARGLLRQRLAGRAAKDAEPVKMQVLAPVGGMASLLRALADALGERILLKAPVHEVRSVGRHLQVLRDASPTRKPEYFDHVVLATPAYRSAKLIAHWNPELAHELDSFSYLPVALLHLGFRRNEIAHPLDGFGFLTGDGEDCRIQGCVFESSVWRNRAPSEHVLLRAICGGGRDPAFLQLDDESMRAVVQKDLARILQISAQPTFTNIVRWPKGLPHYGLGHTDKVDRVEALCDDRRLTLVGNSYRGVSVAQIVANSFAAARKIAGRLLILMLLWLGAAGDSACGSGNNPAAEPRTTDGGQAKTPAVGLPAAQAVAGATPSYTLADRDGNGRIRDAGAVDIDIRWSSPPAHLLRPQKRVAHCGEASRTLARIDTLDRVAGAIVYLEEITRGKQPPAARAGILRIDDCAFDSSAVLLARTDDRLVVSNRDERPYRVVIEPSTRDSKRVADMRLTLIGQSYDVVFPAAGIYRARTADYVQSPGKSPAGKAPASPNAVAYIVVASHPYYAVTDEEGRATLASIPSGRYRVVAWLPPAGHGEEPVTRIREVEVVSSKTQSLAFDFGV